MPLSQALDTIVLIADPVILAVPVLENDEPLIDIVAQKDLAYGPAPIVPENTDYTKMRKTIYNKLLEAQALLSNGLRLCLYEAYRSEKLQEKIFQERYEALQKQDPKKTHEQLFVETTRFASPNINLDGSRNVPPHSTGSAVDVYLIDRQGKDVDMGIHVDDTYDDIDCVFSITDSQVISAQAKANRRILSEVMTAVGFVNYPMEYWHWSYGDRYWAYHSQNPHAFYGSV